MTNKIGPYDFTKLHIAADGDNLTLYERRRKRVIVSSTGQPKRVIPDNVDPQSWHRLKHDPTDKVVWGHVLVPVKD